MPCNFAFEDYNKAQYKENLYLLLLIVFRGFFEVAVIEQWCCEVSSYLPLFLAYKSIRPLMRCHVPLPP